MSFLPLVTFDRIPLEDANRCLSDWGHKMGPLARPNNGNAAYGILEEGAPVAVAIHSSLIRETVATAPDLTRENCIELSRLCASRPHLCRVALRLWREFVFLRLRYPVVISYQDADLHNGNTYRFDGWRRIGFSRSGTDTRSGRKGRNKWIWRYDHPTPTKPPEGQPTTSEDGGQT